MNVISTLFRVSTIIVSMNILTPASSLAAAEGSILLNLPTGVQMREVVNKTTVPLQGDPNSDICTAEVVLPKFQYTNPLDRSIAMARLERKWFKVGLRSVNEFLKGTSAEETCKGQYFSAYQINLDYAFTAQFENLISMIYFGYTYSGGAHGYGGTSKSFLDLATGKAVPETLDNFLMDSAENNLYLLRAVDRELSGIDGFDPSYNWSKKSDELEAAQTLKEWSNFYFTPTGIKFFWNAYEIGAYSMGTIEVEISWEELSPLKSNSEYGSLLPIQ